MKKELYLVLGLFFLQGVVSSPLLAQEEMAVDEVPLTTEWQNTIDGLKNDTDNLLQANQKLTSEYSFLKEKLSHLHESIASLKTDIENQEKENQRLKEFQSEQVKSINDSHEALRSIQNEISSIEAERKGLKETLAKDMEKTQLQKQRLDGLLAEKRNILLEVKMLELSKAEMESSEDADIVKLKGDIEELETEEAKLTQRIEALTEEKNTLPLEITQLKTESRNLGSEIASVQKQIRTQEKLNEAQSRETERLAAMVNKIPSEVMKERQQAHDTVTRLERRLNEVRKAIADSASIIEAKRKLMDDIMRMDASNQDLRAQVTKMINEVSDLKQEVSELEVQP